MDVCAVFACVVHGFVAFAVGVGVYVLVHVVFAVDVGVCVLVHAVFVVGVGAYVLVHAVFAVGVGAYVLAKDIFAVYVVGVVAFMVSITGDSAVYDLVVGDFAVFVHANFVGLYIVFCIRFYEV